MKRYGNLYEKICSMENLQQAHINARKGKGWYQEVKMVNEDPEKYLTLLQEMLINHTYKTSEYEVFTRDCDGKIREIYKLPYFPDRICQWAVIQVIEPYLLNQLIPTTYSALPGRGIHKALTDVKKALQSDVPGCQYCLKMDVKHYYPSINHTIMKEKFKRLFKDPELLWLLNSIIDSVATGTDEDTGVPIGNYLSQYCGNIYLSGFDHWIKEEKHIKHYFRYMDDIVIFGADKRDLHRLKIEIDEYFREHLRLKVKENWQVFPSYVRGIDFVGYRMFMNFTLVRKSICKKFKKKMVAIRKKTATGQMMNYSEWCSVNSYKGWLVHCDSYRLNEKYIVPLQSDTDRYYQEIIKRKDGKGND